MLKVILRSIVLLLILLSSVVRAQDEKPAWETILYVNVPSPSLVVISSDETKTIPLPENFNADYEGWIVISRDKQWLAYQRRNVNDSSYGPDGNVRILNLNTGTCCDEISPEMLMQQGVAVDYDISLVNLVDFSPFEESLLLAIRGNCGDYGCSSNLVLYHLATGVVDTLTNPSFGWIYSSDQLHWLPKGIRYSTGVQCMEGNVCLDTVVEDTSYLLDPLKGETLRDSREVFRNYGYPIGEHLESTGEFISAYNLKLQENIQNTIFGTVVVYGSSVNLSLKPIYVPEDAITDRGEPFDYYQLVKWVMGGDAVLISTKENGSTLLMRDGSLHPVDLPQNQTFLATTTDGWLMIDDPGQTPLDNIKNFKIDHYTFSGELLKRETVTEVPYLVRLVTSNFTPGSQVGIPFPTLPEPEFHGIG